MRIFTMLNYVIDMDERQRLSAERTIISMEVSAS